MNDSPSTWSAPSGVPRIEGSDTHVWRIPLDRSHAVDTHMPHLSAYEQERVRRFYFPKHGLRYAIAHSALRRLLGAYLKRHPLDMEFATGEHGKPDLVNGRDAEGRTLHFNLSHSSSLALVAVSVNGAVGVDVERWRDRIEPLEIAERFFSPFERDQLFALPVENPEHLLRGFFSTWSRKEAYLKATGHGISRGLHHFDVTVARSHDESDARLIADRLDPEAVERWRMHNLVVAPEYSAALVTTRQPQENPGVIRLFESPYM